MALLQLMPRYIRLPTQEAANTMKAKFHHLGGFPNVIGCVDGTHIRIQGPRQNEHEFVNRKNYHSINAMVRTQSCIELYNLYYMS